MKKTIYLAGGCFWGTQKYLDQLQGVLTTEVGFANGNTEAPTYEEVCHNNTGHAETVRVEYDAQQLPLARLLKFYFASINPTSLNQQRSTIRSILRKIQRAIVTLILRCSMQPMTFPEKNRKQNKIGQAKRGRSFVLFFYSFLRLVLNQ